MSEDNAQMGGRPSIYTEDIAEEICLRLSCGESLRNICKDKHLPCVKTIMLWLMKDEHEGFLQQYTHARSIQAEYFIDDIINIADDSEKDSQIVDGEEKINHEHINRAKLRVDTRKWAIEKLAPKKYGKKVEAEHTGNIDHGITINVSYE